MGVKLSIQERNQRIALLYPKTSQRVIADMFCITQGRVSQIVRLMGGKASTGKPPVWPDCPQHLIHDYHHLRRYMTAAEAKAMLEEEIERTGL